MGAVTHRSQPVTLSRFGRKNAIPGESWHEAEGTGVEPPRKPRKTRGLVARAVQIAVHSTKTPRILALLTPRTSNPTSPRS